MLSEDRFVDENIATIRSQLTNGDQWIPLQLVHRSLDALLYNPFPQRLFFCFRSNRNISQILRLKPHPLALLLHPFRMHVRPISRLIHSMHVVLSVHTPPLSS